MSTPDDDPEQVDDEPLVPVTAIEIADVVPDGMRTVTDALVRQLAMASSAAMREFGGTRVEVAVRITDDILAATAAVRESIGLAPEANSTVERVGGVLAGKTFVHEGRAVILVVADLALHQTGEGQVVLLTTLAHEFGHVIYGTLRDAVVDAAPDTHIPWKAAAVVNLAAVEEYRVDLLGDILATTVANLTMTDDTGQPVDLAAFGLHDREAVFGFELDRIDPGLTDAVMAHRVHQLDLMEMWHQVVSTTSGIAVLAAHAAAEADERWEELLDGEHPGLDIVGDALRPLLAYLSNTPLIPASWVEDRQQICDIGLEGWMEAWARLGLHPRPDAGGGEDWYLHVTGPAGDPPGGPWDPPRYEITPRVSQPDHPARSVRNAWRER